MANIGRWKWLPVPVFLLAICLLRLTDSRIIYESGPLLVLLNFLFSTLASMLVVTLVARTFLARPSPGILAFGCGVLLWGGAGTFGPLMLGHGANATVTIHNSLVCLSALCHVAGAMLSLKPGRSVSRPRLALSTGYALAGCIVWLVVAASLRGLLPVFFEPGRGGTSVRQVVLLAAITMYVVAAGLLRARHRRASTSFVQWYSLALLLIAVGLTGAMMQTETGSLLNWTARAAQLVGGAYILLAALSALRESGGWITVAEEKWDQLVQIVTPQWFAGLPAGWRYSLAIGMVVVLTALRCMLVPLLGTAAPTGIWMLGAAITAVLAGVGPGLLFVFLGIAGVEVFVLESLSAFSQAALVMIGFTLVMGVAIVVLLHVTRVASTKAQQGAERLAIFAAATFEGIVESEEGIIRDCNEQFAQLAGYSTAELQDMPLAGLIAPEDRDRVLANIQLNRESVIEHGMVRKDGTRILVEAHGRSLAANSRRRHTAIRDVTPRKQAEEALRVSEEHYRSLFENSPDAVFLTTADGGIISANPAACALFGMSEEEFRQSGRNGLIARHVLGISAAFEEQRETGQASKAELSLVKKNGERLLGEVDSVILPGNPSRSFFIIHDITERTRAEEALRDSEARLNLALASGKMGSWSWDMRIDQCVWNDTEYELLGLPVGDGRPSADLFFKLVHPDDIGPLRISLDTLTARQPEWAHEFRVIRPDGQVRWLAARGRLQFGVHGQAEQMYGVNFDITERKKNEAELKTLNDELERRVEQRTSELQIVQQQYLHAEKLSAIGKLSASIAHEFNNPLQSVMTVLKGLQKTAGLEGGDLKMLELAIGESERMKKLIASLRDFNRPSADHKAYIDVHQSIESILTLIRSDLGKHRIDVTCDFSPHLPQILAVHDQFKQVMLNLLTNAIDACAGTGGGRITISTRREGERVAVAIQDTGVGIKAENMENIFRPFYTTKAEVKGTGLGLAVSYGIVKKHNGEFRVESEPGAGTTMTVLLPIDNKGDGLAAA